MHWIALLGAGCLEVAFTTCLKLSDGFSKWTWTAAFVACAVASFALLSVAARTVPLGTAYAVWTGLGAVGTIIVGAVAFREDLSPARIVFLSLIVVGIVGVKLVTPSPEAVAP